MYRLDWQSIQQKDGPKRKLLFTVRHTLMNRLVTEDSDKDMSKDPDPRIPRASVLYHPSNNKVGVLSFFFFR